MMNNTKYLEIILTNYPQLDKLCDCLEKSIFRKAIASFSTNKSTLDSINEIVDTIERRNMLIRLRNICNIVFSRMNKEEIDLFSYKYFNKNPSNDFDCSSRNYFRKQKRALEHFKELLGYIGINEKVFFEDYSFVPYTKAIPNKKENKMKYNCPASLQKRVA